MDRGLGRCSALRLFSLFLPLVFLGCNFPTSLAYQNFTVGDEKGWTFPTANVIDYQNWVADKNFTLGDYLFFNYPQRNHNVIVTFNESVYKSCDYLNSNDYDFIVWGRAGTTNFSAVPLVQAGTTYFFCGAYDGDHCKEGMKFAINVTEGEGLPPSLMIPPPPPADASSDNPPSPQTYTPGPPGSGSSDGTRPSYSCMQVVSLHVLVLLSYTIIFM